MGVAGSIAKGGHGGAVLLVPESYPREMLMQLVQIKYACNDDSVWKDLREAVRVYDGPTMEDPDARERARQHESRVEDHLSRMAKLASVDGAIVVTDRLRLLGFGGEVIAPSPVSSVVAPDGSRQKADDFGTRHRSAFRFCAADPSFMAVVCSQDGGVKYIVQRDGDIKLVQS